MIPTQETIQKLRNQNNWYAIIDEYGCTIDTLNTSIENLPFKEWRNTYLDLGFAYAQLSNIKIKKKRILNEKEFLKAYQMSDIIYSALLKKCPNDITVLNTAAYFHYKFVINWVGIQTVKRFLKSLNWDIIGEYTIAEDLFQHVLKLRPNDIKANYRYAKMIAYAIEPRSVNNIFWEAFKDTLFKHPIRIMIQSIQMLHTAINTYHEYEGENKKALYQYFIKSHYTLAVIALSAAYDNSFKQEIFEEYLKNPNRPGQIYNYRFYSKYKEILQEAKNSLFVIMNEYDIHFATFDAKAMVLPVREEKRKYPINPREVLYRLGEVYAKNYRITTIKNGLNKTDIDLYKRALLYYWMAIQYVLWVRKKGFNVNFSYEHISKKLTDIKRFSLSAAVTLKIEMDIRDNIKNWLPPEKY